MAQYSSQHAYKRLQDRPKTASSCQGASQGGPREAKILQNLIKENQCVWPSRLFASDGLLRPQDGSKIAQEGPKRAPRGPQESPKRAQEASTLSPTGSTMAPRGLQDAPRARDRKGLDIDSCRVVVSVVILIVVVFALFFFLVVVPFVLPCSSREHRPTTR